MTSIAWLRESMALVKVPFGTSDWAWWMTLGFALWIAVGSLVVLVVFPWLGTSQGRNKQSLPRPAHVDDSQAFDVVGVEQQSPPRPAHVKDSEAADASAQSTVEMVLPPVLATPVALPGDAEAGLAVAPPPAKLMGSVKAPRAEYLDVLKIFLTFLVVFHHAVRIFEQDNWFPFNIYVCRDLSQALDTDNCRGHVFKDVFVDWTTAINTSYFMNLFFLISGYFTPSSLDRKGIYFFLGDKFKRLGVPSAAWFFVFGPLLWFLCLSIIFGASFSYGENGSWITRGPPWFVAWLLTFNVVYAMSDGAPIVMSMPRVGVLIMMGIVLGALLNVTPTSPIMAIPAGVEELIVSFLFFTAGIIGKRNGWLEQIEAMPQRTVWLLRALAAALLIASFALKLLGHYKPENLQMYDRQMSKIFLKGLFTVVITFVELDFFRHWFQNIGRFMRFLADASYAVFLIHPYVLAFVAWGYVEMVRALGVEVVKADLAGIGLAKSSYAPIYAFVIESEGEGLLWGCFGFTFFWTIILVWPISEGVRRLPGCRQVL